MSNNLLIVPSEKPSSLLMVPVTAVKEDLITKTDELIYVPIATKNTYGVVKIGEGLHILNGVLTIDPSGQSLNTKVNKFQGAENEGKVLLVDKDGYVSLGYAEGSVDVFSNGVSAVDDAGALDFSSNFIITEENGKAKISLTGIPEKLSDLDLDLDIAYRLDIANHNTDPNSHLDIRGKLLEVEAVAKGRSQAISYDNYMYMINAFNTLPINEYSVGQSIYIGTLNVPDLWISKVEDTSETYAYTSDEAIINLLNTNGNIRVGYYVLSPLETEKVDLTDYVTLDTIQTVSGIKTFTEQIGLLNAAEGEADFIKHINNNFLITSHDGKSLLNIDEQLEKIYSFNKELATKEYVDEQGGGSGVSDYLDLTNLPVLNTNNSSTLSINSNETIKGTLNLHKVSKTGLLSDLIEDNNHRVVTDTEKATWNSKLGANALLGIEGDVDTLKTKTLLLEDSYNELYADINDLETNKVDKTTTVNGKALSGNIELNAGDVGALPISTQIPTVNNGTLTIQKNGTNVATFSANQSGNATANIVVPTQASDVNALPNTTKYGTTLSLSIDNKTYVVTAQLKDQDGNNLGEPQTIDLPLESVVVSGSYNEGNKSVVLTLKDGSTIEFSVADLVSGLVTNEGLDLAIQQEAIKRSSEDTILSQRIEGKYTKPSAGIPKSDLANTVQSSLDKADSALEDANAYTDNKIEEITLVVNEKAKQSDLEKTNSDLSSLTTKVNEIETKNTEQDNTISDLQTNKVDKTLTINGKSLASNIKLTADDVDSLPNNTKYGYSLELIYDNNTYKIKAMLYDQDGNGLSESREIDLPLESVVVSGSYDKTTKKVILTLKDGSTVDFSVADLVSGLASQSSLDATNNTVSALTTEINTIKTNVSGKLSLSGGTIKGLGSSTAPLTIQSDATISLLHFKNSAGTSLGSLGVNASKKPIFYDSIEHELALKSDIPTLATVATTGSYNDLLNKPTIPSQVTVDSSLSDTSVNAVQNKVIKKALDNKLNKSGGTLTGPLIASGGNGDYVGKFVLDAVNQGQITDTTNNTLIGFVDNNATFKVGNKTRTVLSLEGIKTRPTYNGNNLALLSDVSDITLYDTTGQNTDGAMTQKVVTDELEDIRSSLVMASNALGDALIGSGWAMASLTSNYSVPAKSAWAGSAVPFGKIETDSYWGSSRFTLSDSNKKITYNGDEDIVVEVRFNYQHGMSTGSMPTYIAAYVQKNGKNITNAAANYGTGRWESHLSSSGITTLSKGDYIYFYSQYSDATTANQRLVGSNTNLIIREITLKNI